MSREQAEGIRERRGQVGRASRSPGQLWQVPLFFAGLLAFIAAFVTAPSRQDNTPTLFQAELNSLRQGLEPDQEKPPILVAKAENALTRLVQFPRKAGEIHFLAGSAYFRQANQCPPDSVEDNRKKAIYHLEEAFAIGVAAGDLLPLQFRLGFSLYQQGKEPKRALDLMAQSVDKGADRPAQGYGLLVQAYLTMPKPNLDAALGASQKQLELTDDRNIEDMALARLMRGELLLRKEQRPEALKELERIGPKAPRPLRLKARLLQTRVCEQEGLWNRAIPVWKELLGEADGVPGGKARVLYALGLAYLNGDPTKPEQAMASWEEAFGLGGIDGDAAGIRLGEIRLFGPAQDAKAALAIWTKVLANVRTPTDYKIEALELSRAREIFENACRLFLENQDYEQTRLVADLYKKLSAPGIAEERIAQAAEGLARDLKDKAGILNPDQAKSKMEEVRSQYHRAAVAYEEAAMARKDDGQADVYWRSAQCYLAAQDYTRAGAVLGIFVSLEKRESLLAEAWLSMAKAYVALGNKDKARQAYYKCIEFPLTPFAFRARYQLALEEKVNKNYVQACAILQQNLTTTGPGQDRSAHEESIYTMAELCYLLEDFDKAALYYKEAFRQYPTNPGVLAAQDQLCECYRKLADQAKRKMQATKEGAEDAKAYHQRTRLAWLEQGATAYQNLADEVEHRSRQNPLTTAELGLLRKALFGAAELRFDMNEFSEALRRYQGLQEKYRKQVEGLIACQRIWLCVGVMVETPEQARLARTAAAAAVLMARADLEGMPETSPAFQGAMGVWSRTNWQDWLRWVGEQLSPPTAPARPNPVIN